MKRVISVTDLYIPQLWGSLYYFYQCDEAKERLSGLPLTWLNSNFLIFALCPLLFVLTYSASATTQVLTGPTVHTRDADQSTTYVNVAENPNIVGRFTLVVNSGDPQIGADRVTNVLIELSGVLAVSPNNLKNKVGILEKSVQLQESESVSVRVKETPETKYRHTAPMASTIHDREDVLC